MEDVRDAKPPGFMLSRLRSEAGHHDHRDIRHGVIGSNFPQHGPTIEHRHHHIEHHDIRPVLAQESVAIEAVLRRHHREVLAQRAFHQRDELRFVIDQQYLKIPSFLSLVARASAH